MADEKQRKQPVRLGDIVELTPPSTGRAGGYRRDHWSAKIANADATGATDREAVEALRRRVEKAFEPNYSFWTMHYRGYLALVWKELESWSYKILSLTDILGDDGRFQRVHNSSSYNTKEEAMKHIPYDLAQICWDGEEEVSTILTDEEEQKDFAKWVRWQKEYRRLKATGLEDNEIRNRLLGF